MPFIEMPLEDAKEAEIVPEGFYDLQVVSVKETESEETGRVGVNCAIKVMNPPADIDNPALINQWIGSPIPDDTASTRNMILLNAKRFLTTFNVPFENGFDPSDLQGAQGECLVTIGKDNRNDEEVNKLQLPKLEK